MIFKIQIIIFYTVMIVLSLFLEDYVNAVIATILCFVVLMYNAGDLVMSYFVDKYFP